MRTRALGYALLDRALGAGALPDPVLRAGARMRRAREERGGFLLSTAEMWGWRGGDEWMLSHYLLERRGGSGKKPLVRAT